MARVKRAKVGDDALGMHRPICRRDFINAGLIASGSLLMESLTPREMLARKKPGTWAWDGYGGVGDYRDSHGNMEDVMNYSHQIRDGVFNKLPTDTTDTGEIFDCVIVGGGLSGLAAALFFHDQGEPSWSCLVLDDHPIFGGEAKRNEFIVNGQRLLAPQGSVQFMIPYPRSFLARFYERFGMDWRKFRYQAWAGPEPEIAVSRTPYQQRHSWQRSRTYGFYLGAKFGHRSGVWLVDPWGRKLEGMNIPAETRAKLRAWFEGRGTPSISYPGDQESRKFDAMSLEEYITKTYGLSREDVRLFEVYSDGRGLGADALSAYTQFGGLPPLNGTPETGWQMLPSGNCGMARLIVKTLIPDSFAGPRTLEAVCRSNVNFDALDQSDCRIRIRLGSTVVRVKHEGEAKKSNFVRITYTRGGKVYRLRARCAVMAGGCWTTKHIVEDLPALLRQAYQQFYRCPYLVANVAVTNWRFMYKLGISGAQWFNGIIGDWTEVRKVAKFGAPSDTFGPDSPTVLALNVAFKYPGFSTEEQGNMGRAELLSTSFSEYERKIREQFTEVFSATGFDARRDIAGIILNRWGHAFLTPQPGFFFGKDGNPAPRDLLRNAPFGRISFANTDLAGFMDHQFAFLEAHRAIGQVLDFVLT
jgi:spermidine dehydrogenase